MALFLCYLFTISDLFLQYVAFIVDNLFLCFYFPSATRNRLTGQIQDQLPPETGRLSKEYPRLLTKIKNTGSNAGTHNPHLNRCFRNTFYSVFSSGSFSSEASSFSSSSAAVSSASSFISSAGISVFGEASSSVSSADISAC